MKYNIATITDYLEELTGNKTRRLDHAKGKDKKLPLAIATSYGFYDLEFMETQVTIAIPSGLDSIAPIIGQTMCNTLWSLRNHVEMEVTPTANHQPSFFAPSVGFPDEEIKVKHVHTTDIL